MATRAQKIKVGVFLIASLVLLVGGALVVSGFKRGTKTTYNMKFNESILGLNRGGLVEYLGVPVGTVSAIRVTPDSQAYVEIQVEDDKVTLHKGVTAQLVIYSLATGMMAISLEGGDPAEPVLSIDSEIPTKPSLLGSASSSVEDLLENLNELAADIKVGFEGIEKGQFKQTLDKLDKAVENAGDTLAEAKDTLKSFGDKAEGGVDDVRELVADIRAEIKPLSESITELADNANKFVTTANAKIEPLELGETEETVREALAGIDELAEALKTTVTGLDKASETMILETGNIEYSLRDTLRTVNETLEAIRSLAVLLERNPSSVVYGKPKIKGEH